MEPGGQALARRFAVLGLDRLEWLLITAHSLPDAGVLELTARFDGPEARLLALLPGGPVTVANAVPSDAAAALAINWDEADALFGKLRDLIVDLDRGMGAGMMEARVQGAEAALGVPFSVVAGALGSGMAVYLPPALPGELMRTQDWTAVLLVKNRMSLEESLLALATNLTGGVLETEQVEGLQVTHGPGRSFHYALLDDRLVVAGSMDALVRYGQWLASPGRKGLEQDAAREAALVLCADADRLLRGDTGVAPGARLVAELKREGRDLKLEAVVRDFGPAAHAGLARAYPALIGAMLVPATARAREEARKAASMNNLRQIGLAVMMYAQDHDDEYPPDLTALVTDGYLDERVLVDPADEAPPGDPPCSYVFIGPVPDGFPPAAIVCYVRKGVRAEGRNVLCRDTAVTWADEGVLRERDPNFARVSLAASYAAVVEALGNNLTPEVDKRLREFYEIEEEDAPGPGARIGPPPG
jgi:hypothetical protein